MIIPNSNEIELAERPSPPIQTSGPSPPTDILPTDIPPIPLRTRGRELWRKASIKALTFVRMNHFNRFINNVYYGMGTDEKELEEASDEKQEWVLSIKNQ